MAKTVREHATEIGMKAMGKMFEDPKRAEAFAQAIGRIQQGKAAFDSAQEKALKAAGLVTREDFKSVGKRLSALKRLGKELDARLDELIEKRQR